MAQGQCREEEVGVGPTPKTKPVSLSGGLGTLFFYSMRIETNSANNKPTYLNGSILLCWMRFDLHMRHSHCVVHSYLQQVLRKCWHYPGHWWILAIRLLRSFSKLFIWNGFIFFQRWHSCLVRPQPLHQPFGPEKSQMLIQGLLRAFNFNPLSNLALIATESKY